MKITIFAITADSTVPNYAALGELLKHIPVGTQSVLIQAPPRRPIDLRACQRPGWLEYVASCDDKVWINLTQITTTSEFIVKVT